MSKKVGCNIIHKLEDDFEKNRKYIDGNLIRYSKSKYESEFIEFMITGYLEMAEINLELSNTFNESQVNLQYKFDDINEYEKWLCGV